MSGTLKIAAKGALDQWFTKDPQMSYFFVNYKRHSKFSVEQVEMPFSGTQDWGKDLYCEIPYSKGDLIKNLALRITMNDIEHEDFPETIKGKMGSYVQTINLPYVPSVCTELIDYVDLFIGGQHIQRLTGEYIYIHQQLNNSGNDVKNALRKINGHGDFLDNHTDDAYDDVYEIVAASMPEYNENNFNTYILDLPFYFYREPSLSIPMCALQRQKVEMRLKLKEFNDVIFGGRRIGKRWGEDIKSVLRSVSLESSFGFLMNEERHYLMTRPIDYVITQVQLAQFNMEYPLSKKTVMLNFRHPVKELFFIVQNDAYKQYNNTLRFQEIQRVELRFNNQVVFDGNHDYLVYDQPMEHHVNIPEQRVMKYRHKHNEFVEINTSSEFGVYSFGLHPDKAYPTGQVNMSRITHKMMTIEIDPEINDLYCPKVYGTVLPKADASEGRMATTLRYSNGRTSPAVKTYVRSKDNKVRVYAVNYNVLRVAGGLGGLKF